VKLRQSGPVQMPLILFDDANRVAALISRAKTTPLTNRELELATQLGGHVRHLRPARKHSLPGADELNLGHWFQPNVISELIALRGAIEQSESDSLRAFLTCILSSIIVAVSNQESETRYAAIDKSLPDGEVARRFIAKLTRELPRIRELSVLRNVHKNIPQVFACDARDFPRLPFKENSVDLVVTSPPYAVLAEGGNQMRAFRLVLPTGRRKAPDLVFVVDEVLFVLEAKVRAADLFRSAPDGMSDYESMMYVASTPSVQLLLREEATRRLSSSQRHGQRLSRVVGGLLASDSILFHRPGITELELLTAHPSKASWGCEHGCLASLMPPQSR
jgi:hypothetical protein